MKFKLSQELGHRYAAGRIRSIYRYSELLYLRDFYSSCACMFYSVWVADILHDIVRQGETRPSYFPEHFGGLIVFG